MNKRILYSFRHSTQATGRQERFLQLPYSTLRKYQTQSPDGDAPALRSCEMLAPAIIGSAIYRYRPGPGRPPRISRIKPSVVCSEHP